MTDFFETEELQVSDIGTKYRVLFGSEMGREVLADILVIICGIGGRLNPNDPVEVERYNVGQTILGRMKKEPGPIDSVKILNAFL
jgi:hypothetical protein